MLSTSTIIRAWKDESFRNGLSEEDRLSLPAHPSGLVELSNEDLGLVVGGTGSGTGFGGCWCSTDTSIGCSCVTPTCSSNCGGGGGGHSWSGSGCGSNPCMMGFGG
jgi:mersacidin/lichenicidin family type 2 lantibiotic